MIICCDHQKIESASHSFKIEHLVVLREQQQPPVQQRFLQQVVGSSETESSTSVWSELETAGTNGQSQWLEAASSERPGVVQPRTLRCGLMKRNSCDLEEPESAGAKKIKTRYVLSNPSSSLLNNLKTSTLHPFLRNYHFSALLFPTYIT